MTPKVSVVWPNYNSMHIIHLVKKSLDSIIQLRYSDFEFIIVDNGSCDGSFEAIREHVDAHAEDCPPVKILRTRTNLGFAGGCNHGYAARDRRSKYVALINNDAVARPGYLDRIVSYLERNGRIGAAQGIVGKLGQDHVIDSAGFMLEEDLTIVFPFKQRATSIITHPFHVSYVEGTMPVYRVSAVENSMRNGNTLFVGTSFMYFLEDIFVSLMLWNHGYSCGVFPFIAGEHLRGASIRRLISQSTDSFYMERNKIALLAMTNSKDRYRNYLKRVRRSLIARTSIRPDVKVLQTLHEGLALGTTLKKKYGSIDIYKVPLRRSSLRKRLLV